MKIKVINKSPFDLPAYATAGSAGLDLRANIEKSILLVPGQRTLVKTGIFMALPEGYEAQIRPRSGLALKHGISIVNSPGTIDADYRGEIGVILINHGDTAFEINPGERICQMVINKFEQIEWEPTDTLDETERGADGYNSTGVK